MVMLLLLLGGGTWVPNANLLKNVLIYLWGWAHVPMWRLGDNLQESALACHCEAPDITFTW